MARKKTEGPGAGLGVREQKQAPSRPRAPWCGGSRGFFFDHTHTEQGRGSAEVEGRKFDATPGKKPGVGFPGGYLSAFLSALSYLLTPLRAGGDEKKRSEWAYLSLQEKI